MRKPDSLTPLPIALVGNLRSLIVQARQQAVRSVNAIQVQTYWQIGRHIVEFEQDGQARAAYGQRLLTQLGQALAQEFGKGFDASNLRYMRLFYQAFPICDALRHELSWTHYRLLLRVEAPQSREWYMQEAATQNWSTRVLERQIGSLYYERLLSSRDKASVQAEAAQAQPAPGPRHFVRDPVMLEFLGLPDAGRLLEADLEQDQRKPTTDFTPTSRVSTTRKRSLLGIQLLGQHFLEHLLFLGLMNRRHVSNALLGRQIRQAAIRCP